MAMIRTAALLLQHRGVTGRWLMWWGAAWIVAIACSRIGIPPVAPQGAQADTRALEQLGTLGLCVPLPLIALLLNDRSPWLSASTPRSRQRIRLGVTSLITGIALTTALAAAFLYPEAVAYQRVTGVFALIMAITIITAGRINSGWAALPAPALIAASTVPGLIPWTWNIIYNPATNTLLTITATAALILALTGTAIRTTEQDDRAL